MNFCYELAPKVVKMPKQKLPVIRVVTSEICESGRYLIVQRPDKAVFPGFWEFPGGRVREEESDEDALTRTLLRRIGCEVKVGEKLLEKMHHYSDYTVCLVLYRVNLDGATARPCSVKSMAWVGADEFTDYQFPPADEASAKLLLG
jgi:8-oxo-dGTP diphosphatase